VASEAHFPVHGGSRAVRRSCCGCQFDAGPRWAGPRSCLRLTGAARQRRPPLLLSMRGLTAGWPNSLPLVLEAVAALPGADGHRAKRASRSLLRRSHGRSAARRRRSSAIASDAAGFHAGRPPREKGHRYPADPPTVEEIAAVMRTAGDRCHGCRLRGLIVVLWRAGLRIHEALALNESDLDHRRGALLVRRGKGGRRRESAWTNGRGSTCSSGSSCASISRSARCSASATGPPEGERGQLPPRVMSCAAPP
jgi:hypothetical protein